MVGDVDLLVGVGLCGAGCADFLGCGQYAVAGVLVFLDVRMILAMVSGGKECFEAWIALGYDRRGS